MSPAGGETALFVAGNGLLRFHRPECELAAGRSWSSATREQHEARVACPAGSAAREHRVGAGPRPTSPCCRPRRTHDGNGGRPLRRARGRAHPGGRLLARAIRGDRGRLRLHLRPGRAGARPHLQDVGHLQLRHRGPGCRLGLRVLQPAGQGGPTLAHRRPRRHARRRPRRFPALGAHGLLADGRAGGHEGRGHHRTACAAAVGAHRCLWRGHHSVLPVPAEQGRAPVRRQRPRQPAHHRGHGRGGDGGALPLLQARPPRCLHARRRGLAHAARARGHQPRHGAPVRLGDWIVLHLHLRDAARSDPRRRRQPLPAHLRGGLRGGRRGRVLQPAHHLRRRHWHRRDDEHPQRQAGRADQLRPGRALHPSSLPRPRGGTPPRPAPQARDTGRRNGAQAASARHLPAPRRRDRCAGGHRRRGRDPRMWSPPPS